MFGGSLVYYSNSSCTVRSTNQLLVERVLPLNLIKDFIVVWL